VKAFLDANVLFTAAVNPEGMARRILSLRGQAAWRLVASPYVIEEARRNLERKAGRGGDLKAVLELLELVPDAALLEDLPLRQKDRPVLAAAIHATCDFLVTGDKRDFGPWLDSGHELHGLKIISVAALAKRILES
jgi:predicted nucleic acid-binding protein